MPLFKILALIGLVLAVLVFFYFTGGEFEYPLPNGDDDDQQGDKP